MVWGRALGSNLALPMGRLWESSLTPLVGVGGCPMPVSIQRSASLTVDWASVRLD